MRGPYQGTWQAAMFPTIKQAPDVLVFINGELDLQGCPQCRRRIDINKYVNSVSVQLSVDSAPGSASVNLHVPRHSLDDFIVDGDCILTPMMEVEIFSKGAFLVEGVPQYYPIFWGLITEVGRSFSEGVHSFTVQCADILKWWDLCKMNINPAFTQASGQLGTSIFGNVLFGTNPYDLIWSLALQSFGDVVVGTGSLVSLVKENQQKSTFNAALSDIMLYWQQRLSRIRSNLLLYGTQGNAVRGDVLFARYQKLGGAKKFRDSKSTPFASQAVRQANGGDSGSQMVFDPTDPGVTAFRTQFSQAGQVNFWQSEYQSKLEIANTCKEAIGFEFYMDVTGDIVFKPPFYNLDIIENKPVSWIQDADIISLDLNDTEADVVTQIQLTGSFGGNVDYGFGEEATPTTSVTDYHLLRKYGWRAEQFTSEFMGSPLLMFYVGLDMLDRKNARRHNGSVTIMHRPELRLGFPVYFPGRNETWYVSGIDHNIEVGGRAQTTLTLTARRTAFVAPTGLGTIELTSYKGPTSKTPDQNLKGRSLSSKQLRDGAKFKVDIGDAAQIPPDPSQVPTDASQYNPYAPLILRDPRTGRRLGYPDVVLAYTRPFNPPPDSLAKNAGRKTGNEPRPVPSRTEAVNTQGKDLLKSVSDQEQAFYTEQEQQRLKEKLHTNRYSYGLNSAGVFTYLEDKSAVIKDVLIMPIGNIDFGGEGANFDSTRSGMIRPISDERGFEVIGHFRYGRGVSLRDGSLVLNGSDNAVNSRAVVEPQTVLSGGLFEVLQAQSAGLTTGQLSDHNPSYVLARMQPEDLRTGAVLNRDTGEPEFSETETNFVDTAPLGSQQQAGSDNADFKASVEASQLSRALTLAEMSVREERMGEDANCGCILGRPDLAFINLGYKLKIIGASGEDNSTIQQGAAADTTISNTTFAEKARKKAGDDAYAATYAEMKNPNRDPFLSDDEREQQAQEAAVQASAQATAQYDRDHPEVSQIAANEDIGVMTEAIEDGRPIQTELTLSRERTMAVVESYLANLYSALDGPHQTVEKALRGDLIDAPITGPDPRFSTPTSTGYAEPPFGPGYRATGGDPAALAATANSATQEFDKTWDDFGADIDRQNRIFEIQRQIQVLKQQEGEIKAQIALKQGVLVNGQPTNSSPELDQLRADLAQVQQQIAQLEMALSELRNA